MVHFPSGGICLLRICNIPVSIPLSPLFPGAILQTGQSGLGYVNILSKTHITQRIALRIFLLVLLFNSLLLLLLQLLMIFFYHNLLRLFTNYAPQAGFLTVCPNNLALTIMPHQKFSIILWGSFACPAKCNDTTSRSFCLPNPHI